MALLKSFLLVMLVAVVFKTTECQLTSYTDGKQVVLWEHTGHSIPLECTIKSEAPSDFSESLVKRSDAEFEEDKKVCMRHTKQKRFVMIGTKWCGDGNEAKNYDDLGIYPKEDSCCRTHDHCERDVLKGETKFGVHNTSPYTWSDCDCDKEFNQCLSKLNTTISNMIGDMFFNVLKGVKCVKFSADGTAVAHAKMSYKSKGVSDLLDGLFG